MRQRMKGGNQPARVLESDKPEGTPEQERAAFQRELQAAALGKLQADPTLVNRSPELERMLRALVGRGKSKASAPLTKREIDTAIVEAGERAREEFRHKPHRLNGKAAASL